MTSSTQQFTCFGSIGINYGNTSLFRVHNLIVLALSENNKAVPNMWKQQIQELQLVQVLQVELTSVHQLEFKKLKTAQLKTLVYSKLILILVQQVMLVVSNVGIITDASGSVSITSSQSTQIYVNGVLRSDCAVLSNKNGC
ncbi:Hypothetical_protein [Hexamita inflata]|uniref:Hypothetical_protein n=1 Tax=Hexamita inflata TaxID=28002 RepID=A0AA86NDF8_9EUKA|nr:Hypothetical protein HINF_LOCUS4763 [Hexamita inflata]